MTSMRWAVSAFLVSFLAGAISSSVAAAPNERPGLTVDAQGTLLKDGKPCRAVGINYFEVFERLLHNPADTDHLKGFDDLGKRGIPFVRFMAGGYWPSDWKLYMENPQEHFRLLDNVVKAAEKNGVGLIPSLFWYDAGVCDLVGEPRNRLGDPDSKTIAFIRKYTREVVTRYADSPAIWAWELGNEYNLSVDLPNAADHRPAVWPQLGTAAKRTPDDDVRHDTMVTVLVEFAKAVREIDATRPIVTGHGTPRSSAHHLRTQHEFTLDSRDEFKRNMVEATPDPVNVACAHVYPPDHYEPRFSNENVSYDELLGLAMEACRSSRKVLFVGEFGASELDAHRGEGVDKEFARMLEAIQHNKVPLAAAWNYAPAQRPDDPWCITPDNDRSYMLDAITKANRPQP